MFFKLKRVEPLVLKPRFLNKNIDKNLLTQLRTKVEGRHSPRHGYTIAITTVNSFSVGVTDIADASAHFLVTFEALMFRLFKDEVALCRVERVSREGVTCVCGPAKVFIHVRNFGFAATFEDSMEQRPHFVSANNIIEEGSELRVLIISDAQAMDTTMYIGKLVSVVA